jgi:CheY-like chemotaxis protein
LDDAGSARFLVVEDDAIVRRALARIVRPFGEAALAASVGEARRILSTPRAWRGFVIDIHLPDGSGLHLLEDARVSFPDTPAIVLTGSLEGDAINAAYDLGAAYLVKPVAVPRIQKFLEAASSCGAGNKSPRYPAGSIPETFRGCVEQLQALFSGRQDVPTRYAIGATIAAIKARPHLFGAGAILAVARALDEDLPSLYRHAAVAEQWTPVEMEALMRQKGQDGRSLSWSHLAILGSVTDREARARLVTRAIDERLSVRELSEIVAGEPANRPDVSAT